MNDAKQEPDPPPPLCVYCSAPWTDDMVKASIVADTETGYYGESLSSNHGWAYIDVNCASCKRLVYRKAIETTDSRLGY